MNTDNNKIQLTSAVELHRIAEVRMEAQESEMHLPMDQEATRKLVHELGVHQIELSLRNEELRDSRYEVKTELEKYTDLYEHAPVGYFTLEQSGVIIAVNLSGAALLRVERSLLTGSRLEHFITEEYRQNFTAFMKTVFSGHGDKACEVVMRDNAGLHINIMIEAIVCTSGIECRLALLDITGQKNSEVQERERQEKVSRMEPITLQLELSVCSIKEALDATLPMLRERALNGAIEFQLDLAPESAERIVVDREKLQQILYSLLSNALKFSHAGGIVQISSARDGDLIRITVADSGIGICEKEIPSLFDAITTLESVYYPEDTGSGIGLALTRLLVELHGGTVWVESEVGTGSRFNFTIPLKNCAGIT